MTQISLAQAFGVPTRVSVGKCPENFSNEHFFRENLEINTDYDVKRYLGGIIHLPLEFTEPSVLTYHELARDFDSIEIHSPLDPSKMNVRPWMIATLIMKYSGALAQNFYPTPLPVGVEKFPEGFNEIPAENVFWVSGHMIRVCHYRIWTVGMHMRVSPYNPFRKGNRVFSLA